MAEHVGHERLKAEGRPFTCGAFSSSSSSSSSSSISRFEGTDGRGCGKARHLRGSYTSSSHASSHTSSFTLRRTLRRLFLFGGLSMAPLPLQ
jgi:hypothetical protein